MSCVSVHFFCPLAHLDDIYWSSGGNGAAIRDRYATVWSPRLKASLRRTRGRTLLGFMRLCRFRSSFRYKNAKHLIKKSTELKKDVFSFVHTMALCLLWCTPKYHLLSEAAESHGVAGAYPASVGWRCSLNRSALQGNQNYKLQKQDNQHNNKIRKIKRNGL